MTENRNVKILIVDDMDFNRKYLRIVLPAISGIKISGEAENGKDAIKKIQDLAPDVVFMDVSMPVLNGIHATKLIKTLYPETIVIAFSTDTPNQIVEEMKNSGASDYLEKSAGPWEIERAIRDALP